MSEEKTSNRNIGTLTGIVFLIAIAVGLLIYYYMSNWILAIGCPLAILGVYEIASSFARTSEVDRWGTSEASAAVTLGFIALAIGAAFIAYNYSDSIIVPIIVAILIVAIYLVVVMLKRKN
jgi:hypothetical protein